MAKQFRQFIQVVGIPLNLISGYHNTYGQITLDNKYKLMFNAGETRTKECLEYFKSKNVYAEFKQQTRTVYKKVCGYMPRNIHQELMFVVEDDDEAVCLAETKKVCDELTRMKVTYREVCRWFCLKPEQKTKRRRQGLDE